VRSASRSGGRRRPHSLGVVALLIQEEEATVDTPTGPMRTVVFSPQAVNNGARFPSIAVYSEIYQVTGPVERICRRLAGNGFIVGAGDVYHEYVTGPLEYNPEDTDEGNRLKTAKPLGYYDSDFKALVDWMAEHPFADGSGRVATFGLCLGGGLALRAATMVPRVRAAVCLFPTDLHNEGLGQPRSEDPGRPDETLDMIARGDLAGEALLVFGNRDTHVDMAGRTKIREALCEGGATFQFAELAAGHAFLRDEKSKGRQDPAISEVAWEMAFEVLNRRLTLGLDDDAGASIRPI